MIDKVMTALRANGYRPLRVGSAVFASVHAELKEHEALIGRWQRYSPPGATEPTLMVANTPVQMDMTLAADAIE